MAASDHINEQLKMFMSPNELQGYVHSFGDFGSTPADVERNTAFKLGQSRDVPAFVNSVATEGVKKPLEISHFSAGYGDEKSKVRGQTILSQGHHRYVSQMAADPDRLMPVLHHPDSWSGRGTGRYYNMGHSHQSDPTGEKAGY